MYTAVGIDVSKGKSTVSVLQPGGVIVRKPFIVEHSANGLDELTDIVLSLGKETKVVMECTGRYHQPILNTLVGKGIFVSAINPHLIKNYGNNSIRKVKSDPSDAKKIARYAIDNWADLKPYSVVDTTRAKLKVLNAQMDFFTKQKVSVQNNLVSLLDMTYPGINNMFSPSTRNDGSEKWVDYVSVFWHVDCVRKSSLKVFAEKYKNFCKKRNYHIRSGKTEELYEHAKTIVPAVSKDDSYKVMIMQVVDQHRSLSESVEKIRAEMNQLASSLPEYETVMSMAGVGKSLGPQLIAEIGDITKYTHREALTAFAGVDPGVASSGRMNIRSNRASKCGPPRLRRTLFVIMMCLLKTQPTNDPVYQFINKKRLEGKPYLVYMTAGANKFLRIYYGRVKEQLSA